MLSICFLSSRELSTALLSGGVLPVMIIGWVFGRIGRSRAARDVPQARYGPA